MNEKELIDKITREVMEKMRDTAAVPAVDAGPSVVSPRKMASTEKEVLVPADVAKFIDHTLLKADATSTQIDTLCSEASSNQFHSVCVNTGWTKRCAKNLRGTGVKVCVVVGFPLGAMSGRSKGFEARHAIEEGADEVDMVMNIGALKERDLKTVEEDIKWVKRACGQRALLKVIIETSLLTDEEKVIACEIIKQSGADYVKTSTGFSTGGATVRDVTLMRRTVGPKMGVKAAGGVRTFDDAVAMIEAGATRLGTSGGVKIIKGEEITSGY